jgi:urocanate hydratase
MQAYEAYASLMRLAPDPNQPDLGGQFLYVGELDNLGRSYTIAANIAGAATLAASGENSVLRSALREGVIDFLVNSLDEALRILKNEIRKHQPVAVAVSLTPDVIESEMLERGVRPDLLTASSSASPPPPAHSTFLSQGARQVAAHPQETTNRLLIWSAPEEYTQNMATFDEMLAGYLEPSDHTNRRWLRLSPRYLGPAARRFRSLSCANDIATRLIKELGPPLNQ